MKRSLLFDQRRSQSFLDRPSALAVKSLSSTEYTARVKLRDYQPRSRRSGRDRHFLPIGDVSSLRGSDDQLPALTRALVDNNTYTRASRALNPVPMNSPW